jgi:hypothetical protein
MKRPSSPLHEHIGHLISRGQFRRALDLPDKVIEDAVPLFQGEAWVMEERRLAWLYRIDLLREAGHLTEALAWACLEVEVTPEQRGRRRFERAVETRSWLPQAANGWRREASD